MKVQIDFGQVEDFKALDQGKYEARIQNIELRDGNAAQQLLWKFVITEGAHEGETAIMSTSFSPKALFKLKQILEAFGLDATATSEFEVDEDTNMLVSPNFDDHLVTLTVGKPREWNGSARTDIQKVEPRGKVTVSMTGNTRKGAGLK